MIELTIIVICCALSIVVMLVGCTVYALEAIKRAYYSHKYIDGPSFDEEYGINKMPVFAPRTGVGDTHYQTWEEYLQMKGIPE